MRDIHSRYWKRYPTCSPPPTNRPLYARWARTGNASSTTECLVRLITSCVFFRHGWWNYVCQTRTAQCVPSTRGNAGEVFGLLRHEHCRRHRVRQTRFAQMATPLLFVVFLGCGGSLAAGDDEPPTSGGRSERGATQSPAPTAVSPGGQGGASSTRGNTTSSPYGGSSSSSYDSDESCRNVTRKPSGCPCESYADCQTGSCIGNGGPDSCDALKVGQCGTFRGVRGVCVCLIGQGANWGYRCYD